jgi:hypothetical protein
VKRVGLMWLIGLVVTCTSSLGHAQDLDGNYVQIRGLFPPENGAFSSAPAIDALLRLPIMDFGTFELKLDNVSLVRQRVSAQFSAEVAFFGFQFRNEPSDEQDARVFGINALGAYKAPSDDPVVILRGLTLAYSLDQDTGPLRGYAVHSGNAQVDGDIAERWDWSVGYTLANGLIPTERGLRHDLQSWVRTTILKPVNLGVGAGYIIKDEKFALKGSLEAGYEITPDDTVGARVTLTTAPGDAEEIFYDTTRFEPLTIGLQLGRSNESFLTWGVRLSASPGVNLNGDYSGQAGENAKHDINLGFGYSSEAGNVALRGGVQAELDPKTGLWYARITGQITANLRLPGLVLQAVGELNYGPERLIGRFTMDGQWVIPPFVVLLNADFRFHDTITGLATVEGLYFFLPGIAVNLTTFYRAQPAWEGPSGFGVGLGLRTNF